MRQIPATPGVKDLQSLIAFLEDVKRFKKQLIEMEELRTEVNGLISAYGKIQDIDKSLARQRSSEIAAEAKVRNAETAAKVIAEEAERDIAEQKRKLADRLRGQSKRENDVARDLAELVRRENHLADQVTQLSARENRCAEREAAAAELRQEYEERLARIKAAAAG